MTLSEEEKAVAEVVDRLRERFPFVDPATIGELVNHYHHDYDGHPIRAFVPVLVESQTRAHLAQVTKHRVKE